MTQTTGIVSVFSYDHREETANVDCHSRPGRAPSLSLLPDNRHVAAQIAIPFFLALAGPPNTFSWATVPVVAGQTLVLYGTGFGPTSPNVLFGKRPYSGSAPDRQCGHGSPSEALMRK